MHRKRIVKVLTALFLIGAVLAASSCESTKEAKPLKLPSASYLIDNNSIEEIHNLIDDSGLENTEEFTKWAEDFAATSGKKAKLSRGWHSPDKLKGYLYSCAEFWEKTHNYSDANCRITAMLLTGDLIKVGKKSKNYSGTYLMMDLDAIENAKRYSLIKKKENEFTTLFGEMKIPKGGISRALPDKWKTYDIHFDSEKLSLISVVIKDPLSDSAFVGHTGVLINKGDYLLFLEKLAFEQPYQATKLKNTKQLIKMLSSRSEYSAEDGDEPSVICQNDKVIGRV